MRNYNCYPDDRRNCVGWSNSALEGNGNILKNTPKNYLIFYISLLIANFFYKKCLLAATTLNDFFLIWRTRISDFFSWPFPFYFSALLLSLPFAFDILGQQSLEMRLWSIEDIMGHFTTIFAPKLITLFFNLLRHDQNAVDIQNKPPCCAERSILAAYEE